MKKTCLILLALLLVSTVFAGQVSAVGKFEFVPEYFIKIDVESTDIGDDVILHLCGATITTRNNKAYTDLAEVTLDKTKTYNQLSIKNAYDFKINDNIKRSYIIPEIASLALKNGVKDYQQVKAVTLHFLVERKSHVGFSKDGLFVQADKFSATIPTNTYDKKQHLMKIELSGGIYTNSNDNIRGAQVKFVNAFDDSMFKLPSAAITKSSISDETEWNTSPIRNKDDPRYEGIIDPTIPLKIDVTGDVGYWNTLELYRVEFISNRNTILSFGLNNPAKWNDDCSDSKSLKLDFSKKLIPGEPPDGFDPDNITDVYLQFNLIRKSMGVFKSTHMVTVVISQKVNVDEGYHITLNVQHTYKWFGYDGITIKCIDGTTGVEIPPDPAHERSRGDYYSTPENDLFVFTGG